MKKSIIKTNMAPAAVGPYSQAIKVGNLLFVSGQIPLNTHGVIVGDDVTVQTNQVLSNLKAIIDAAGMTLANVVKCTCFIKNMDDFAAFNAVYTEYFASTLPARECIEVARLPKDTLVEVSAICHEY
jgi:2-iminobutanoate/2-iminopropanoate deaminase